MHTCCAILWMCSRIMQKKIKTISCCFHWIDWDSSKDLACSFDIYAYTFHHSGVNSLKYSVAQLFYSNLTKNSLELYSNIALNARRNNNNAKASNVVFIRNKSKRSLTMLGVANTEKTGLPGWECRLNLTSSISIMVCTNLKPINTCMCFDNYNNCLINKSNIFFFFQCKPLTHSFMCHEK